MLQNFKIQKLESIKKNHISQKYQRFFLIGNKRLIKRFGLKENFQIEIFRMEISFPSKLKELIVATENKYE